MNIQKQLEEIARRRKADVTQIMRETCINIGNKIILRTPVLDGRLINNWMSATGSADTTTTFDVDPSGEKSKGALTVTFGKAEAGQSMFFTNSLPYARRIEYEGHSAQAPAGMVRVSVKEFRAEAEAQIRARR